jgi:hypothetical protein
LDGFDGALARKAIVQTFGATALIQRCQEHKRRNVLEHLPVDTQQRRKSHGHVARLLADAFPAQGPGLLSSR